jgi:hypothetical protein
MTEKPSSFPLSWPAGWPRTDYHKREVGKFSTTRESDFGSRTSKPITVASAQERLGDELDRLGARYVVLSTNLELRLDGKPRGGAANPHDSGTAIYFQLNGKPIVLACDNFITVASNMAAIAAHINVMRGMSRWRVGRTEQLFSGYVALPGAVPAGRPWWQVLGWDAAPSGNAAGIVAENRYKAAIKEAHPDTGGSHDRAAELNAAIAEARKILK